MKSHTARMVTFGALFTLTIIFSSSALAQTAAARALHALSPRKGATQSQRPSDRLREQQPSSETRARYLL